MQKKKELSKKGAASIYAVIFASLLFGIITVSFIRLVVSETQRTMNDDLSQSAYDAALAGVEDAKTAILAKGLVESSWSEGCNNFVNGGQGEVVLGSHTSSSGEQIDQAYTCVLIYGDLKEYKTTLDNDNRIRVISAATNGGNVVKAVEVSWYSKNNFESSGKKQLKTMAASQFSPKSGEDSIPPVAVITLVPDSGENVASFVMHPVTDDGDADGGISEGDVENSYETDSGTEKAYNIKCDLSGADFACNAIIPVVGELAEKKLGYIAIDLPYGENGIDFSIKMSKSASSFREGDLLPFANAQQVKIDSTGRANDLYRRVEARVDFLDQNYPIPEYAVYAGGDNDNNGGIIKNFWVTINSWSGKNSGEV